MTDAHVAAFHAETDRAVGQPASFERQIGYTPRPPLQPHHDQDQDYTAALAGPETAEELSLPPSRFHGDRTFHHGPPHTLHATDHDPLPF